MVVEEATPVEEAVAAATGRSLSYWEQLRSEAEILLQQQVVLDRLDDLNSVAGMLAAFGIEGEVGSTYIANEGRHVLTLVLRDTEAHKLKVLLATESLRRFGGISAKE